MNFGPPELILILVIIVIFFGVGRLPEVFGAVGKGLREFRKAADDTEREEKEAPTSSTNNGSTTAGSTTTGSTTTNDENKASESVE